MPIVKVHNDNTYDYKELFRDKNILIPAGKWIEMEYDEALLFKGSYSPILTDGDKQPLKSSYKMIRVEEPAIQVGHKVNDLMCQQCRYTAHDKSDLVGHLQGHAESLVVDQEAEALVAAKRSKK